MKSKDKGDFLRLDPSKDLLVPQAVPWEQPCRQQEVSSLSPKVRDFLMSSFS